MPFIIVIASSLSGCDRSGNKSNLNSTSRATSQNNTAKPQSMPSTPLAVSNKMPQMKIGSKATYDITSTTKTSGHVTQSYTGTTTLTTMPGSVTPNCGGRAIDFFSEMEIHFDTGGSMEFTATEFVEQLPNGTCYFYGGKNDDTARYEITSTDGGAKPIYYMSPIVVGKSYEHTSHFSDGSTQQWNVKVISMESINGKLAYRINKTVYDSRNGSTASCDEWFLPNTIFPVKMNQIINRKLGRQTTVTGVLKAKNL